MKTDKLNQLLEQVTMDITDVLAKAETQEAMEKAAPGEEAPGEETPAGSSVEGTPASDGSPEASPGDQGPGEQSPGEQSPGEAPGEEQSENPATDETQDPEALKAEYMKLPPEELKLHFMAAHAALMELAGGDQGQEGAPEGAPGEQPQAPAPAEGTPAPGEQSMVQKKEIKASEGSGGTMKKSESAFEQRLKTLEKSLKEKDDTIQAMEEKFGKAVEGITTFIQTRTGVGLRKSISGISFDKKPGDEPELAPMAKSEVVKKLNELTASPSLKKSDRELINKYLISGTPQSTIAHLLK